MSAFGALQSAAYNVDVDPEAPDLVDPLVVATAIDECVDAVTSLVTEWFKDIGFAWSDVDGHVRLDLLHPETWALAPEPSWVLAEQGQ